MRPWICSSRFVRLERAHGSIAASAASTDAVTLATGLAASPESISPVNWKAIIGQAFLLVAALALGITVGHSTLAKVVLFGIVLLLGLALFATAMWTDDRFWRGIGRKIEPHLPKPAATAAEAPRSAPVGAADPTDEQLASAIDDLLDELATIDSRLTEAIDAEFYGYKFFLPASEYHKHKATISTRSGEARAVLSEVYVQADALNSKMPGPTADGIEMALVDTPDPVRLRETVSRARAILRQLRA